MRLLAGDERVEPVVELFDCGVLATAHAEGTHDLARLAERVNVRNDVTFGVGTIGDMGSRDDVGASLDHRDRHHGDVFEAFRHRDDSLVELDDFTPQCAAEVDRKAPELTGETLAVGTVTPGIGELLQLGVETPVGREHGTTGGCH